MKTRFILSVILLCCCAFVNAQETVFSQTSAPAATVHKNLMKAPQNAIKWGYTLADNFIALGTGATGTFGVAIKVPGTGELKGSKVVSVNLPVYYTGMENVSVWGSKNLTSNTKVFTKAVTETLQAGYMEIPLDEPYVIDGDFFVGYTFTISSVADAKAKYPIGKVDGKAAGSLYINQNGSFVDWSNGDYGMSALQIYLTDVRQEDYDAVFRHNKGIITVAGSENTIPVELYSNGRQDVNNIEYTVEINGNTDTKTTEVTLPGGFRNATKVNVSFLSPSDIEPYSMKLTVTKVNGEENTNKTPLYIYGDNVTRKAPYKSLIEEFTGTGCGNCPRGWVGMEAVKEQCSDIALPIAVHQYNSTDPMYIKEDLYAPLPLLGAPSAIINRDNEIDPYFGSSEKTNYGVLDDLKELENTVPPVDIQVKAIYNEDKTKVETTAEIEFLGNSGTYSTEYVLTADGLKGTSSGWRQENYYLNRSLADSDVDPESELAEFFTGGKYGKNPVFLTFNDVAIASSYVNYVNTSTEMPIDFVAGDKFNDTFTLSMPTKASLKSAIQYDQVYANVMVFDENGYCVNAARVRVLTEEEATGIENVNDDVNAKHSTIYTIAGQRIAGAAHGVYIKNGKKYVK